MGNFDGMDPNEIQFITQPFWRELVKQIEKDPGLAYTITQDGKPIAVIISPEAHERALAALHEHCSCAGTAACCACGETKTEVSR